MRPTCGACLLTDVDTALSESLCLLQGKLTSTDVPADAVVDWLTLRPLQCCNVIRKGCSDDKTKVSAKEGLKKFFFKCGDGYRSCECAFNIVEPHENANGMWVPAGTFSLQWNNLPHDHRCVSLFACSYSKKFPFVKYAGCSVCTKKVHPDLKKLVQEHAEILAPMYAESSVRDLFCVPPLSRL